jgi:hypothetical protein
VQHYRVRKKKLIVAFHFHSASQAGWKCEQCRRQGLEEKRRCGWLPEERRGPSRVVWVRARVSAEECPTSLVTPQSLEWLEKFHVWKFAGGRELDRLPAKDVDAFVTLEKEWREMSNGQ